MGVISGRVGGERGEEEEVDDGDDDNRGRREGGGLVRIGTAGRRDIGRLGAIARGMRAQKFRLCERMEGKKEME